MKVLQSLGPQTNSAAVEFLSVLKRLEQEEQADQDWLSPKQEEQRPWPLPSQIVASIKMLLAELRKMKWAGTLRDVHERAGISERIFDDRMSNRQCTMCGSAEHFLYSCPDAQPYKAAFTTAARNGGRQADDGAVRTRQQRYLPPPPPPHDQHLGQTPPQQLSPSQVARDMHIGAARDARFKREQGSRNVGGGQAKRAELNYDNFQDSEAAGGFLSDDDAYDSASSTDFQTSPQHQGGSGNVRRG